MSIYLSESDNKAIGNFIAERQIWVDFLLKYIKKAKNYFEFGAGDYSTVLAANSNLENVYSVETDKTWHTKVKENKDIKDGNLDKVHFLEDGYMAVKSLSCGHPDFSTDLNDWIKYSRAFNNLGTDIQKSIDLVLVDGRFRVACALNIHSVIRDDTIVLFDDFQREAYQVVLDYYEVIEPCTSSDHYVVALKKKKDTNPSKELISKYEIYADRRQND